jgi:hypothetical protein
MYVFYTNTAGYVHCQPYIHITICTICMFMIYVYIDENNNNDNNNNNNM